MTTTLAPQQNVTLNATQAALLNALSAGEGIVYSQDGDIGILTPSRVRLEHFAISDDDLQSLRNAGLLRLPRDPDAVRFDPPEVITENGLAALDHHFAAARERVAIGTGKRILLGVLEKSAEPMGNGDLSRMMSDLISAGYVVALSNVAKITHAGRAYLKKAREFEAS